MRALYMVLVMSANPPSLLGSRLASRLERASMSLVISVRHLRPLVLLYVPAVVEF